MFDFEMPPLDWRTCMIPKKKPGEMRKLTIPNDKLKGVQRHILQYLYRVRGLWPSWFAHGFVPRRDIHTNALAHDTDADVILQMDVKDFFDNFPVKVVRDRLAEKVGDLLADKIIAASSYMDSIPQGGPCSPWLTNIGMISVDCMLNKLAVRHGFHYTRYADDITMSTTFSKDGTEPQDTYKFMFCRVDRLLRKQLGLHLKKSKWRVVWKNGRSPRRITGIVVRKDGLGYNAEPVLRDKARAMVFKLAKKLEQQNGVPTNEDRHKWMEARGLVCYADRCRAYSQPGVDNADPRIQTKYWNYLEKCFGGKKKCQKSQ